MNINSQIGLSWHSWISDPENKALYEGNQAEAMKKYRRDEDDFIQQFLIQERIKLIENDENDQTTVTSVGFGATGGGRAGGGYDFNPHQLGNFVIGTFLTSNLIQVATKAAAGDGGYERFTVK